MMKKVILYCLFFYSFTTAFAQQRRLPEGWDRIILEGKEGYMNLITGEATHVFPTSSAKKPMRKVEVDPSIIHKVQKGETLYAIARRYKIKVDDIYRLNAKFDYANIKVGQEIVVGYDRKKEGKVVYVSDEDRYTNPSNNDVHFVRKGETLYSISRKHAVSVSDLKKYNNLTSNNLKVGQKLRITPL